MRTFTKESLRKLQKKLYFPDIIEDLLENSKEFLYQTYNCPFHDDSGHNLVVSDNKYYCFECGASGDAIEFLMTYKKMTFGEAIEFLADKTGVELEQVDDLVFRKPISDKKKKAKLDKFEKIEKLLKELLD